MIREIWIGVYWILSFFGILCAGYCFTLWLLRGGRDERSVVIVPLLPGRDVRERLYGQYLRMQMLSARRRDTLVALDLGLPSDRRREIERFCASLKNVYVCVPAELEALLRTLR